MEDSISDVDKLVEEVKRSEAAKKELAKILRELKIASNGELKEMAAEDRLVKTVEVSDPDKISLAAVDGGLISKSFHEMDLILLRAIGVVFKYSGGKLASYDYHPASIVEPTPKIYYEPFYDTEFQAKANIERQTEEVRRAKEVVDKFKPDIMFLHGSIVPQYTTMPAKNSLLYESFKNMMDSYLEFFDSCERNGVILAGVVEDSRSNRLCEIVYSLISSSKNDASRFENLLKKTKDTVILNHLLNFRERTAVFSYSSQNDKNPLLSQFGKYSKSVHSFYVKNAELDRPMRVDFLSHEGKPIETADRIASTLIFLSKNSMYAIPPMIVEADQRVKLGENDLELFYSDIIRKLGNSSGLNDLRRSQRPF